MGKVQRLSPIVGEYILQWLSNLEIVNAMKIYALNGILEIEEIQPQAKNVLKISDFFNGSGKALNGKII